MKDLRLIPWRLFCYLACYVGIAICLLLEGALLLFAGLPYFVPIRSLIFLIGCLWVVTCIAAIYGAVRARPVLVLFAGCLLLVVSAIRWLHFTEEKTLEMFLYDHSLELGVIVASLVLCFISGKLRGKTQPTI
jgi:hypothetical protein